MDVREKTTSKKRLIDADALLNEFLKRYTERERNRNLVFAACEIKQDFADMISDFPTVDAVEVVRCRECKHLNVVNRKELYAHCPKTNTVFLPFELDTRKHFCSLGERKEGAD